MSPLTNLIALIEGALLVAGLVAVFITFASLFVIFDQKRDGSSRFSAAVMFLAAFIFGLPMALELSGIPERDLDTALESADVYRAYAFALSACFVFSNLATGAVRWATGWWADEELVEASAALRFSSHAIQALGLASIGLYFGGLGFAALGGFAGGLLAVKEEADYARDIASRANRSFPPSVNRVETTGVAHAPAVRALEAAPSPILTYKAPSEDIASGFDVPPQR